MERQLELAEKIKTLIMFVGILEPDEVQDIKNMRDSIQEQISTLHTIGGLLTPLEESDKKIAHLKATIKRINAILDISESNIDMQKADAQYNLDKQNSKQIMGMFGL